jgi:paraquat-inducible protein B
MTVRSNATAVGAFVLGALAIAVGIAVVFGSGLLFKHVTRYVIFFEGSLEGLGLGAPVKYRGVQIGQVVSIKPSFGKQERSINIPVVIELTRDAVEGLEGGVETVEALTEEGLRARLELASLITGQLYVGLDIFPGTPIREAPNRTDYPQIPSVPSLQTGVQRALSDLLADRPNLFKGIDQMLELLNTLTADGGAQDMVKGARSMAQLADLLADPKGPVVETIGQLPALMADVRATTAAVPGLVHQADLAMASVGGLVGGPEAPVMKTLADLQATLVATKKLSEQLTTILGQTRAPLVGFAQSGLPELQGVIQDADRAVGELSRTIRDFRQDPERFLLGDQAAEGVKLQ